MLEVKPTGQHGRMATTSGRNWRACVYVCSHVRTMNVETIHTGKQEQNKDHHDYNLGHGKFLCYISVMVYRIVS